MNKRYEEGGLLGARGSLLGRAGFGLSLTTAGAGEEDLIGWGFACATVMEDGESLV